MWTNAWWPPRAAPAIARPFPPTRFNRRDVDRFRIRRIDVYGTDTPAMLMRKIRLGTNDGRLSNLVRYYLIRAKARLPFRSR